MNLLYILSFCSIFVIFVSGSFAYAQTEISDNIVILHTSSGDMVIELFQSDAPKTVANFVDLTGQKFYDGTIFHRIIKDFMIQGGDPNTKNTNITEWGYGGSGNTIPAEFNTIMHKRGIVSMARGSDPDSGSSQFFIVHKDAPALDQNYTVFGRLATQESFDTLDKIAELETTGPSTNYIPSDLFPAEIQSAEVKTRAEITNLLDQKEPQRIQPPVIETVQSYSNENLGISFDTTSIWTIQEIQKQDSRQPDIIISGPTNDVYAPRVLIFVKNSTLSLADYSAETKKSYEQAIISGSLAILNEENTSINGIEALIRNSNGKSDTRSETLDLQYREIVFKGDGKFYTFTYANTINNFDESLPQFNQIINSLTIKGSEQGGGCLIATATFGSELAPQVQQLRELRDNTILTTQSGIAFMTGFNQLYYSFSPTVADWERENPIFKEVIKITLTPMLTSLTILNHVDIDSEQEMLGYGIGIILINVGMYFVAPTVLTIKMKNKLVNRFSHV
jgi:peptidyl-prolyl cis-trans isomerase B (cyclophilin B)